MLLNYFRIALRNLLKYRIYSSVNVLGLAIGIASCLLILIYINDELSYDQFHLKSERIYRLNEFILTEGSGERSSSMPFPLGPTLKEDYATMIEEQVRMFNLQAPTLAIANEENDLHFNEPRVFFVDSSFFDVFDFKIVKGNPNTVLDQPGSVLITESMAEKYFPDQDPMGKLLRIQDQMDLKVTGILKDTPSNSHFHFDFLVSMATLYPLYGGQLPQTWYWNPCWTYIVLNEGVTPDDLRQVFPDFVEKYFPSVIKDDSKLDVQALTDIHLTSHLDFEIEANSSKENIYLFGIIAALILTIACINFMNLSTARSIKRAKEVGLRKTLGGQKSQLTAQFLIESTMIALVAVVVSIVIIYFSLPWFNTIAEKNISLGVLLTPEILTGLLVVVLLVGLGAGFYPALVLSSFIPVKVIKSETTRSEGLGLRKILVILQFVIAVVLIVSTVISIQQLDYLRNKDKGFDSEQVIFVPVGQTSMARQYESFKDEVLQHSRVKSLTAVEEIVGAKHQGANYQFEGMPESKLFSRLNMRHDFIRTFDMEIVRGRPFSEDIPTDDTLAVVVNEAMVRNMGWELDEAVGKRFLRGNHVPGEVIGVVKDFNFVSNHREIRPLVLDLNTFPGAFNLFIKYMAIRVERDDLNSTISYLEDKWNDRIPERPFEYFFLDDELRKQYDAEEKFSKVAGIFAGLGILVACLGLFGLSSFVSEQRRREVGIRKVMGSRVRDIVILLNTEFVKLILISFLISIPVSYLAVNTWLNTFAYRVEINWMVFLFAILITLFVAITTVSFQSVKAALMNPVDSIRQE